MTVGDQAGSNGVQSTENSEIALTNRLAVLERLGILDTDEESAYEDAVLLASHICDAPIALISLVTDTRQWFKAKVGLALKETPLQVSFCAHTILEDGPMIVEDATQDERFSQNDLVTGEFHLRFYAGVPIYADDVPVGSVCVLSANPSTLSSKQILALEAVGRQVSNILDHRFVANELARLNEVTENALRHSEALAQQLKEASDRFRNLFYGLPVACMTLDLEGRVVEWNAKSTEVYGYTADETVGVPIIDLVVKPQFRSFAKNSMSETLTNGGYYESAEWLVHRKDGTPIWVLSSSVPVLSAAGVMLGTISSNIDITARKRAEGALKSSNAELEQFAYVASHDLLEPLRMITSYMELIKSEYGEALDEEGTQYLAFALDGGTRMQQLIHGLLDFSTLGKQKINREEVDLESMCQEVALNLKVQLAQEPPVSFIFTNLPKVFGNRLELLRLLQNLVANSLKFRASGPCQIEITAEQIGAETTVFVTDNGIGIDPRFREKVFQIFQRLNSREEYPGSGLGLAICRKIVERHGGEIWIDEKTQTGCRVGFTLEAPEAN